MWGELYAEFADNYLQVEDLLSANAGLASKYISETMLHTERYQEAKEQPLVFRRADEAHWFDVIYRSLPKSEELS